MKGKHLSAVFTSTKGVFLIVGIASIILISNLFDNKIVNAESNQDFRNPVNDPNPIGSDGDHGHTNKGSVKSGQALFKANCSPCHQLDGTGKTGLAPSIRNRDFLAIATDKFIADTIVKGRPGTSMIGRVDLKGQKVDDIIAWLRSLEVKNPIKVTLDPKLKLSGDNKKGAVKYAQYCASCHGDSGQGYSAGGPGPAIGTKGFLSVANDSFILETLKRGRVDTAMKSFIGTTGLANLTEKDAGDIIAFLRNPIKVEKVVSKQSKLGNPKDGKAIFMSNCSPCHQADGKGKAGLAPSIRNRDFLAIASDKFIRDTIKKGRAGTSMIPRADLSKEKVSHIIAYLRALDVKNPVSIKVDPNKKAKGSKKKGKLKYAQYCASCHGAKGEGYSSGGAGPAIGLPGFLNTASDDYIIQTVKQGRIGTAMKSFLGSKGVANLTEKEIEDIVVFLRSLNK